MVSNNKIMDARGRPPASRLPEDMTKQPIVTPKKDGNRAERRAWKKKYGKKV